MFNLKSAQDGGNEHVIHTVSILYCISILYCNPRLLFDTVFQFYAVFQYGISSTCVQGGTSPSAVIKGVKFIDNYLHPIALPRDRVMVMVMPSLTRR
jgi:hypothetical protein